MWPMWAAIGQIILARSPLGGLFLRHCASRSSLPRGPVTFELGAIRNKKQVCEQRGTALKQASKRSGFIKPGGASYRSRTEDAPPEEPQCYGAVKGTATYTDRKPFSPCNPVWHVPNHMFSR